MLTISKALSSSQAQTYHAKEFISAEQNYWKQDGAVIGEWHGRLAERFGLSGPVSEEHFARLAEGQHPITGEQLVRHRVVQEYERNDGSKVAPVEHRAGWDATFSAPKSVSLTALVGGDDRVRQAHRAAVDTALTELERYTQARLGGNRPAETTGAFVVAKFEHDTARPVDGYAAPQLHTHAVIFNVTERESGQTRALQERVLFESQQFATAVYQSELTYRLRSLGYEIASGRSGAPEIKGYSQEYLDASSPRSQQIRAYLKRSGFEGHEAAQIAAHSTRDSKKAVSVGEAVAAHRKLAAEFGHQADRVVEQAQQRSLKLATEHQTERQSPHQAVTYARDRNFEREAVVDERRLYRDALRRGMGELTLTEIRSALDERMANGEFQIASQKTHASARQFTTDEMVRAEKEVIARVIDGQNRNKQIASIQQVVHIGDANPRLNTAQRRVVEEVLLSRDQIQGLQGTAGTGKTTALSVIHRGAEAAGYSVEGFAPTSRAANQLREAGIPADTLQGFLARTRSGTSGGNERHLYFLDESSLSSTRQMRDFLRRIGDQDRVLLIGDARQHQAVEAGKPFEQLQQAGMHTARLDQIIRQRDLELRRAVEFLAQGDTASGLTLLQEQGRIREMPNKQERIGEIARRYADAPTGTLIVSPDNASRRQINEAVRTELQQRGLLGRSDQSVSVLVSRSEVTGADRAWASQYEVGDVLRYRRGSDKHSVAAGTYAQVIRIEPEQHQITVRRPDGLEVSYDPSRLKGVDTYKLVTIQLAVGDRVQFTAPMKDLRIANREQGTVEALSPEGRASIHLDSGRKVSLGSDQMRHLDHGYAVTSHSAQGLTAERVLVHVDTGVHPELVSDRFAYVSISRASQDSTLYTNSVERLGELVSRSHGKSSALETTQKIGVKPQLINQLASGHGLAV
jgi:conjugative relaxase-like TrwC/TraI family protein